ncbi:MAG: response regulator transcription factor [Actinobacteria bacterium]|nr:response regulator transcription factor [Actinomycetota bacterium]
MRVLLATDADWIHDEVDAALADDATEVHRVRRGVDVLEAVRTLDPEFVVLDLQIGNCGGVATALMLRQEEATGRLTRRAIVLLLDRQADVFLARTAGVDGWLVKPLDSLRLRRAMTRTLAGEPHVEGSAAAS